MIGEVGVVKHDRNEGDVELRNHAIRLFGEEIFDKLVEWYMSVIECNCNYIVFIVRRCYVLFLIMQDILGIELEASKRSVFLTDSSVLLHTKEMVKYYELYGRFPSIALIDDIFVHGRNVNKLLHTLEKYLISELSENDNDKSIYDINEIKLSLARATQLKVFVSYKKNRLLDYRYRNKLEAAISDVTQAFWRDFSNKVSELIINSDVLNASFIYSEKVERPEKVVLDNFIKTTYHGCTEYTLVTPLGDINAIRAYATIRLIENQKSDKMRIAPFVFLPNLSENETDALVNNLTRKLNDVIISDWITKLKEVKGRRAYHEMIVLIISTMYLFQVKNRYNLQFDDTDEIKEIKKLSRNYDTEGMADEIEIVLKSIIDNCRECCNSLQDIIEDSVGERKLIKQNGYSDTGLIYELLPFWKDSFDNKNDFCSSIRSLNEIFFYKKGWEEELSAYRKKDELVLYEEDAPRGEPVFDMMNAIYSIDYNNVLDDNYFFKYNIVYTLQMMDVGIVGIAIADVHDIDEYGLFQYSKVGEQSQQLLPLKMYEYISFMKMVEDRAESTHITQQEELGSYFANDKCDISSEEQKKIYSFLSILESIGQEPKDWSGYLFRMCAMICRDDADEEKARLEESHLAASELRHKYHYATR